MLIVGRRGLCGGRFAGVIICVVGAEVASLAAAVGALRPGG